MTEVLIAGGGLAGAAAACLLARAGRGVILLERETVPVAKICGEFLSAEAVPYLADLGIDIAALGARPIHRLRLVRGSAMVRTALPFAGFGLSRQRLDEALLARAAALGADVRRGQTVSRVRPTADAQTPVAVTAGSAEIQAAALFLATGKHDLRGQRRVLPGGSQDLAGFKLHLRLAPEQQAAMRGHVDVILFPDGYAGLQLVEDGIANLCLLTGGARLRRNGGNWPALLSDLRRSAPYLDARLAGSVALHPQPVAIYRVPYGFVHTPRPGDLAGVFRLGDQAGVIPSFTGDGMSIALHTAAAAARVFLAGGDTMEYHRGIRRDIATQIRRATAFHGLIGNPLGQALLMRLASAWPGGLRAVAALTRLPSRALLQTSI